MVDQRLLWFLLIFGLLASNATPMKLFNTEDGTSIQAYDCIYYRNNTAGNNETIPYCIRRKESALFNRSLIMRSCENSGKEWTLKSLKEMKVPPNEILKWNSSIEMVDKYAAYLTTGYDKFDDDKICNCSLGTFGKFCEYEFLTTDTFEATVDYQFHLKKKYRHGSQLWGNITCYTTLINCHYGMRCLAWQNICDGKQQCIDGIDEDHCEELELNECEENEYRCENGACITEQYWLDGIYDCSDKSDEQEITNYIEDSHWCPLTSSRFDCDEATAPYKYFTCGDGEFMDDILSPVPVTICYNYRWNMFFCEYPWSYGETSMWTLQNGHCVEYTSLENNFTEMTELEKCVFYLKCHLTNGKNSGCEEARNIFRSLCENDRISYPARPFFKPYVQTGYDMTRLDSALLPNYIFFNGSIKCVGHQSRSIINESLLLWDRFSMNYPSDLQFCHQSSIKNLSGPQLDKNCWNETKQSFFCMNGYRCISKYRLRNGDYDCAWYEDEQYIQGCQITQKHRHNCHDPIQMCLSISKIGNLAYTCEDGSDEYIIELRWTLFDRKCTIPDSIECQVLRAYIQSLPFQSIKENRDILVFRHFCDTLWQLHEGFDESFCDKWKCPKDHYQCLTGHCIPIVLVRTLSYDWHCPDATDQIGLFRITKLSEHNSRLMTYSELQDIKKQYVQFYPWLSVFISICDMTSEYGCILANTHQPSNLTLHRPCINLKQIGDGIIDCYGGLDERNRLSCGNNTFQQRGFDFHCNNQECIPFSQQCKQRCSNNADSLLCDQIYSSMQDCRQYLSYNPICDRFFEGACQPQGIDEYYCDSSRSEPWYRGIPYRLQAWRKQYTLIYLPTYPELQDTVSFDVTESEQRKMTNDYSHLSPQEENDGEEGWVCGRGIAIKRSQTNTIECFCPPSLYGEYCQYFSDRITIITSLHGISLKLLEQPLNTIKILALLLSDDEVIDHHIFHLPLILSQDLNKKFRFNLIHRRPKLLSEVCIVRFEAYYLSVDTSIKFLAVWEYSIYFPFLPSYRLAQVLKFEKENTSLVKIHICQIANPCLHGSTCHPIMNKINNMSVYYCHCNRHFFGKDCEHPSPISSLSTCSKHALIRRSSLVKSICLCPIHLYGPTCHINHTCVDQNPCGINRGICYDNPDDMIHDYICVCNKKFFGDHCQFDSAMVRIHFIELAFVQSPSDYIMSSIIQLCDLQNETLDLIVREKRVYQGLPPLITEIFHNNHYLPMLGIMKLYHKQRSSNDYTANLKQPEYFILYIAPVKISRINLTSVINMTNYCPSTATAFQKNNSYGNDNSVFNVSVMLFQYHLLCDPPYSFMCFHDENYFCICDLYGHAECSRYDPTLDECRGQCRAGGQCLRGNLDDHKDFLCLCPRCYYGSICQHNTELFSFTLETLLTNDLWSPSIVIQQLFSSLWIIISGLLFLIGLVNNVCSYVTFNRKKPLLVGIGHYLRTVSIINQLTLLILLLKLIHIVLSIKGYIVQQTMNTILCKSLSYLLSCTSRISYWLMGMVAIERVYVTCVLQGSWLKSPRVAKRIIVVIIVGIVVLNIHEAIFYQSIEDPKSSDTNNNTWCVTSYPSIIAKYNQVNIILNYILPFLINLLSTIILMILIIRKRATATRKRNNHDAKTSLDMISTFRSYKNLLTDNQELILAPLVTMLPQLFSLPQFILSFSLVCQEFKDNWQRYLLIVSYFITYLPQVLSYKLYVSSSSFYRDEFNATELNHKIIKWRKLVVNKKSATLNKTTVQTITKIN